MHKKVNKERIKAKAIGAELLKVNLKNKLEETGKQDETGKTGRNRTAENRKKLDIKERNRKKQKETERNRKKQEET